MRLPTTVVFALAILAAGPALAQYKVVGPDGKITYTDRPVAPSTGGQVQPMRAAAVLATTSQAPLPLALRSVAERFPVVLYTSTDCQPCDSGRTMLQQRGVPFAERMVASDDDIEALQRLTAGRTVPVLTVGAQVLRGFLGADWQSTLDLAGYPKASQLPRGWAATPATPLVARVPARDSNPSATTSPTVRSAPTVTTLPDAEPTTGIRF